MTKLLVLDLFCKAGGASRGLAAGGFDVIGVDIEPQKNYPFEFLQIDAFQALDELIRGCPLYPKNMSPMWLRDFSLIWASPPCQAYSVLRHITKNKHPELVEPTRERLIATGCDYVIENVPGAPLLAPTVLCGSMFGLGVPSKDAQLRRHRLFETNWPLSAPVPCRHSSATIGVYGEHVRNRARAKRTISVVGHFPLNKPNKEKGLDNFTSSDAYEAMGIHQRSMSRKELSNAVPPAYSKYIAKQWFLHKEQTK